MNYVITARQPGATAPIQVTADEHIDAAVVAVALRAQGWAVTIRRWTKQQRRAQDSRGRWRWYPGYSEVPVDYTARA